MTPELAPPLLTTTPHQREDVSALDRFNVHRCPIRRVFSGTGLERVTRQARVQYLYHSATAARYGVTVWRRRSQVKCHPRLLMKVQNYEICCNLPSCCIFTLHTTSGENFEP
ncbi:uncharacterized protein TNCV_1070971 [Trichonephila clavipes]|nr:uncharacterized protein TNCV_1070971 [Trichonephila clavipes]